MACRIFICSMGTLSCNMWDPVPWPGFEPKIPTMGAWKPSHWTTRKIPVKCILREGQESRKLARMSGFCKSSLQKYWGQSWRVSGEWTVPNFGSSTQVSGVGPPPTISSPTELMALSQLPGGNFIQAWAHAVATVFNLETGVGLWFNLTGLKFFSFGWWGMDRERIGTEKLVFYWSQWFDRSLVLLGPHCGRKKKKLSKKEVKREEITHEAEISDGTSSVPRCRRTNINKFFPLFLKKPVRDGSVLPAIQTVLTFLLLGIHWGHQN